MPFFPFLILLFVLAIPIQAQQTVPLDGEWQFAIDRSRDGTHPKRYTETVSLPGSMLTNGKGDPISVHTQWTGSLYDSSYYFNPRMEPYRHEGRMKIPFFLTPERHYVGHAWYCRKVTVPREWKGRRVTLFLERPHIETTLWVNGRRVGHEMSLSVPHQYDITDYVTFGADNQLEIQVYNGIENVCVGQDSHSVTDQTQGNWNGIAGRIELRASTPLYRKRVETDIVTGTVRILLNDTVITRQLPTPVRLWSEHTPELYTIEVEYQGERIPITFGFRDIRTEGRHLLLNGNEI
ncbi:MAG: beta-glucuronidase, partial [Prevotella sp.]|nr:beta-glucuronidase [Prevotella sp.]